MHTLTYEVKGHLLVTMNVSEAIHSNLIHLLEHVVDLGAAL